MVVSEIVCVYRYGGLWYGRTGALVVSECVASPLPQVHGSQRMFLESGIPFLLVLYSQVSQELPPQNGSGCVQARV